MLMSSKFSKYFTFIFLNLVNLRNGEMVLYFYFEFNRQAVHIENESDLQDYLLTHSAPR